MGRKSKSKHICDIKGNELFEGDDVTYICRIRKIKTKGKIYYTKKTDTHFVLEDSCIRSIHLHKDMSNMSVVKILDK
jgi:uncharacterized Zn ribbon protein